MFLLLSLIYLLLGSHFEAFLIPAIVSYYTLDVLRIGLGFIGRFPCAGKLQILLLKTRPKYASEEGQIKTSKRPGPLKTGPLKTLTSYVEGVDVVGTRRQLSELLAVP